MNKDKFDQDSISSTWSEPIIEFNRLANEKYLDLLRNIEFSGKIILTVLVLAFIALSTALILFRDLEQVIFTDGTELTCMYDNTTNKIVIVNTSKGSN